MEIVEIVTKIVQNLPSELKNNYSLNRVKDIFLSLPRNTTYTINVREDIYNNLGEIKNNDRIFMSTMEENIYFYISSLENQFEVTFSLREGMSDILELSVFNSGKSVNKNYDIVITLGDVNTWKITEFNTDMYDYYLDYNIEMHSYNKNNEEIEIKDVDDIIDSEFIKKFNVPKDMAKHYRLNFRKNRSYLNAKYIEAEMLDLDMTYATNSKLFAPPFYMHNFKEYILDALENGELNQEEDTDDDVEDYLDLDEDENGEFYSEDENSIEFNRISKIYQLLNSIVKDGICVMSYNLYWNLLTYLNEKIEVLNTNGYIIKKLSDGYRLYYVHLSNKKVILIPRDITQEEATNLYESDSYNSKTYGVKDFFSNGRGYTLK